MVRTCRGFTKQSPGWGRLLLTIHYDYKEQEVEEENAGARSMHRWEKNEHTYCLNFSPETKAAGRSIF